MHRLVYKNPYEGMYTDDQKVINEIWNKYLNSLMKEVKVIARFGKKINIYQTTNVTSSLHKAIIIHHYLNYLSKIR
jgi:hypothetical protein